MAIGQTSRAVKVRWNEHPSNIRLKIEQRRKVKDKKKEMQALKRNGGRNFWRGLSLVILLRETQC